jgi:ferritin-like metal-binding protein YciE
MSKKINTLNEALIESLKDIHSAETQLVKALPKMSKNATSQGLRAIFSEHLEETKEQIRRLEEVAISMQQKLSGKTCKAM